VSSTHLIAAGSLVAALAAAAAWYAISPSNTAKPDSASQPAKPQRPLRSRTPSSRPITAPPLADASTTNTASAPNRSAASTLLPNPTGNPANPSPTDAPALSHDDLVARAARIEQETNHDLRRLVSLLNLSDAQQDQVFNALASRSPHWVPGMATAGAISSPTAGSSPSSSDPGTSTAPSTASGSTPSASTTDSATSPAPAESDALSSILPFLTPEQQEALLADEMDKSAWWEEIIPQLLPDESLPAINGDTPTTPDSPETKEFSGPDTLE
jgi:hypothetical protein